VVLSDLPRLYEFNSACPDQVNSGRGRYVVTTWLINGDTLVVAWSMKSDLGLIHDQESSL